MNNTNYFSNKNTGRLSITVTNKTLSLEWLEVFNIIVNMENYRQIVQVRYEVHPIFVIEKWNSSPRLEVDLFCCHHSLLDSSTVIFLSSYRSSSVVNTLELGFWKYILRRFHVNIPILLFVRKGSLVTLILHVSLFLNRKVPKQPTKWDFLHRKRCVKFIGIVIS